MAPAKSSTSSNAGFTLIEVIIAMGLLTVVSLGIAQLFAASTRANLAARTRTSTTAMAEQRMEQLRALTWGFDLTGQGLQIVVPVLVGNGPVCHTARFRQHLEADKCRFRGEHFILVAQKRADNV